MQYVWDRHAATACMFIGVFTEILISDCLSWITTVGYNRGWPKLDKPLNEIRANHTLNCIMLLHIDEKLYLDVPSIIKM